MEIHVSLKKFLLDMEMRILSHYLSKHGNNITRAANDLQVNRTTLVEKLKRYKMMPTCRTKKRM